MAAFSWKYRLLAGVAIALALLGVALAAGATDPFASGTKPEQIPTGVKGTPIPRPDSPMTSRDSWQIIPPESRTDIWMIDVTAARLFLPSAGEAADCEGGALDPIKAEAAIRTWLAEHRSELQREQVWDRTLIGVTCEYPSAEFPGKVVLYIGVPYGGHAYIAPSSCQERMRTLAADEALPPECIFDDDSPTEVGSYIIVVDPAEVLK